MMVMSSSKSMDQFSCRVVPYPLLEENDEHTKRKICLTTHYVPFSPFEDDEYVSSLKEDTKGLMHIEQLNKYLSKFKYVEKISKDPSRE